MGAGAEDLLSPATRPSPLRPQLYSPFAQEPNPSTGHDHHLESFAVADSGGLGAEKAAREPLSSAPSVATSDGSAAATTAVAEDSRPPLHGNTDGFRGHAPPGVSVVETTSTAAAAAVASTPGVSYSAGGSVGGMSREDSVGSSAGGRGRATLPPPPPSSQGEGGTAGTRGEAKLRVCTPTGDGGTSDLSLWVTMRNLEGGGEGERRAAAAEGGARPFSSLSPVAATHAKDIVVGGGRFSSSSASDEEVLSSGGAAKNESEGAEKKEGGEERGDETVAVSSNDSVESGTDESFSDTAPLLAASGRDDNEGEMRGGKGAGTGTRIAVASATAATEKRRPGEGYPASAGWCDVGPVPEVAGGVEGFWRSLSQAFCGLLNFCHPHQGGRGGANWCR